MLDKILVGVYDFYIVISFFFLFVVVGIIYFFCGYYFKIGGMSSMLWKVVIRGKNVVSKILI